jgi:hypothetical protein
MADVGCQEREMLLGTPQRQNQVGTNIHVLRMCARRLGFCELLPLLVGQKNMHYNDMVFLVDKVCCTGLILSLIPN